MGDAFRLDQNNPNNLLAAMAHPVGVPNWNVVPGAFGAQPPNIILVNEADIVPEAPPAQRAVDDEEQMRLFARSAAFFDVLSQQRNDAQQPFLRVVEEDAREPTNVPQYDIEVLTAELFDNVLHGVGPMNIYRECMEFITRHNIRESDLRWMVGLPNLSILRCMQQLNEAPDNNQLNQDSAKLVHWYVSFVNFPEEFARFLYPSNSEDGFSFYETYLTPGRRNTRRGYHELAPSPRCSHHSQFLYENDGEPEDEVVPEDPVAPAVAPAAADDVYGGLLRELIEHRIE